MSNTAMSTRSRALLIFSVALAAPCICVLRLAHRSGQHGGRVPSHRFAVQRKPNRTDGSPIRAATAAASG